MASNPLAGTRRDSAPRAQNRTSHTQTPTKRISRKLEGGEQIWTPRTSRPAHYGDIGWVGDGGVAVSATAAAPGVAHWPATLGRLGRRLLNKPTLPAHAWGMGARARRAPARRPAPARLGSAPRAETQIAKAPIPDPRSPALGAPWILKRAPAPRPRRSVKTDDQPCEQTLRDRPNEGQRPAPQRRRPRRRS